MKARQFLLNTLILTVGSLLLRLIAIGFNAWLSRKIGTEGMGLFQLVFSVYNLASTLATSGIYLAVTRLVAEEIGKGSYAAANEAMKKCMIYGALVSTAAAGLLWTLAPWIGTYLLEDGRTILSLKILALALPFMAFSCSLRGYFFAVRQVYKTNTSQIFEQLVRIAVVAIAFVFLLPGGLEYSCAGIALGSVVGEALAFCYTLTLYLLDRNRRQFTPAKAPGITRRVLSITVPVALSSYLKSALVTAENILIPRGFRKYGATGGSALAQYGMMEAMVMPILTFPAALLSSFSSLLVPEVAESNVTGRKAQIDQLTSRVLWGTLLFAMPVTACFICFADELGLAIYQSSESGRMLQVLAPLVPIMYLDMVADALLKGMDEQLSVLRYSIIDSALSVVLIYTLLPVFGVNGYITVMFVSTFVNAVLSIARLAQVTEISFSLSRWIVRPLFAVTLAGMAALSLSRSWPAAPWAVAGRIILLFGSDLIFLLLTGVITPKILWQLLLRLKPAAPKARPLYRNAGCERS